jgi:hypothetical protein
METGTRGALRAPGVFKYARWEDTTKIMLMSFLSFDAITVLVMFLGSLTLIELGRRMGKKHLDEEGRIAMSGLGAVEGAVFALIGLLIAFTLSGALQRYDDLRTLIVEEANALRVANDRLDMLDEPDRGQVRAHLRSYLEARLSLYKENMTFSIVDNMSVYDPDQLTKIAEIRKKLWESAVAAGARAPTTVPSSLILPALNEVFSVAGERAGANERHPPRIIYLMLLGLGLTGSLLAGFGMAAGRQRSFLHIAAFTTAMSLALFIITDMEYPRQGLITTTHFDLFLEKVLEEMK